MNTGLSRPAGDTATEVSGQRALSDAALPYAPSWVDRVTAWVDRLPLPAWVFYVALGIVLSLVYMAALLSSEGFAGGLLPPGTILLYSFLNGMTYAYLLGLVHYLDNSAAAALARFRPVLAVDDAGYNKLSYQLTTLPSRPTLIASAFGLVYTGIVLLTSVFTLGSQDSGGAHRPQVETGSTSPVLAVLVWSFNLAIYVLVAVVVYHTLHQLRMVNEIYTRHTRINIFQLGPLYALSGLTARTSIGMGVPTYIWFQINSSSAMGTTWPDVIQTIILSITVVVTFIWPLVGAHNLLAREKQRLQDEVAGRMEATINELHKSVDTALLENRSALHETIDALVAEQGVVDKLRTWPWRTGTVSGLTIAFLVPILIWIIQRLLQRLGI